MLKVVSKCHFLLHLAGPVLTRGQRRPSHELLFDVFRTENRDLHEQQLSLDAAGFGVIQDCPHRHLSQDVSPGSYSPPSHPFSKRTDQVFELSPRLFNDTILTFQHNSHPTEIPNFRPAYNEGFDVETPSGEDTRNP